MCAFFRRRFLSAIALAAVSLTGCVRGFNTSETQDHSGTPQSHLSPRAKQLWDLYVRGIGENGTVRYQPGCRPHHFTLPRGVPYRGVAILIHGFTACPQQFFEWAQSLVGQGYEVLTPVMPGFGLEPLPASDPGWPEPFKDDLRLLPSLESIVGDPLDGHRSPYARLAEQMNAIAAASAGDRIIGGLSVGAAVSAHAVNLQPNLYSKALLFAPFIAADPFMSRLFVDTLNALRWLDQLDPRLYGIEKLTAMVTNNEFLKIYLLLKEAGIGDKILGMRQGWGPGCYAERQRGRAGICDFLFSNLAAAEIFGLKVLDSTKPTPTAVQVVGVENDKVASGGHVLALVRKFAGGQPQGPNPAGGSAAACFYRTGANHSLFSRFDAPDENKFWLPDLIRDATGFATALPPRAFPTSPIPSLLAPYLQCRLSN